MSAGVRIWVGIIILSKKSEQDSLCWVEFTQDWFRRLPPCTAEWFTGVSNAYIPPFGSIRSRLRGYRVGVVVLFMTMPAKMHSYILSLHSSDWAAVCLRVLMRCIPVS